MKKEKKFKNDAKKIRDFYVYVYVLLLCRLKYNIVFMGKKQKILNKSEFFVLNIFY